MNTKSVIILLIVAGAIVGLPFLAKKSAQDAAKAEKVEKTVLGAEATASAEGGATPGEPLAALGPLPRFVDLGTTTCAPCKVMLGVMEELEDTYPDALQVQFINTKQEPGAFDTYGVRVIPTQIFYDPGGKELYRHTGVMPVAAVVAKWKDLGYELVATETKR